MITEETWKYSLHTHLSVKMNQLHGQNLLISPADLLCPSTSTAEKSTLACSNALTPFPPSLFPFCLCPSLPPSAFYLPIEVQCEVEPQGVRRTAETSETDSFRRFFSNLFPKHRSNLYISEGLYEQQNWKYQVDSTYLHSPLFLLGWIAKVEGEGEVEVEGDALREIASGSNSTWMLPEYFRQVPQTISCWNYL